MIEKSNDIFGTFEWESGARIVWAMIRYKITMKNTVFLQSYNEIANLEGKAAEEEKKLNRIVTQRVL